MTRQPTLTLDLLKEYASSFLKALSVHPVKALYGMDNGKTIGTYVEAEFNIHLKKRFGFTQGNAASGIDFPKLGVDLKVTSIKQPQSSCPYRNASQKVYGLGYHLLVFVYDKVDDHRKKTALLRFANAVFVDSSRTADHQMTAGLRKLLDADANVDDIDAFLEEKQLPLDEVGRRLLAERILSEPPGLGILTISNAQQWRLQYTRALARAGEMTGVERLL
jgi:hypothetical protein